MIGANNRNEPSVLQIFAEFLLYFVSNLMRIFKRLLLGIFGEVKNGNIVISSEEISRLVAEEAASNSSQSIELKSLISVIIPTYNEQASIESSIHSVYESCGDDGKFLEIIISDGGSTDNTIDVCRKASASCKNCHRFHIATGGTNRSESQNIGAKDSTGNILLFLHADSKLPSNWMQHVWSTMSEKENLAGCFEFRLFLSDDCDSTYKNQSKFSKSVHHSWRKLCMSAIETGTNFRSVYFSLPYGDQALFFRRSVFLGCFNGFPPAVFMEDYDLIKSVRKYGRVVTVPAPVMTSARRWEKNGFFWNTFLNQLIILGRIIGVPYDRLVVWYYGLTKKKVY